jgi:methyltransferase (TIGR00027 family)
MKKRLETSGSRTAEWTCICRAASSLETNAYYRSDDTIALKILPSPIKNLIQNPLYRKVHCYVGAPKGAYHYIIARTKFFDAVYQQAIAENYDHIVILGAGFDTRAIRFPSVEGRTRVHEFDSRNTQQAKLDWYRRGNISIPPNVVLEAVDFEKESLRAKWEAIGFPKNKRCLFVVEGVLMYLEPGAVDELFLMMSETMGEHSCVAFDYVYADVLRHERGRYGEAVPSPVPRFSQIADALRHGRGRYGEAGIVRSVSRVHEGWQFGIEKGEIARFLARYGLHLVSHLSAREMEETYFKDDRGRIVGHVNGAHGLATARN